MFHLILRYTVQFTEIEFQLLFRLWDYWLVYWVRVIYPLHTGTIRVVFTPRAGNRSTLTSEQSLARAGADFVSLPMEVTLEDMQQSAVFSVDVLEVRKRTAHSH